MNLGEKLGIISSAEKMIEIRDLRNEISHEYWMDQLREQQSYTLDLAPALLENINQAKSYLTQEGLI